MKKYWHWYTIGVPNGYKCETQVRLGKDRLGKDNNTISKDIVSSTKVQRVIDVWKCFHQLGKKSRSISLTDFKSTLSYSRADHAINRHCDEDDVSKQYIIDNLGRTHVDEEDKKQIAYYDLQKLGLNDFGTKGGVLINESGLYSLVLSSKLPGAKKFKRWVTSEVI